MSPDRAASDEPRPGPGGPLAHGPVLLLAGARLADGRLVDVAVGGGRIRAVADAGGPGIGGLATAGGGRGGEVDRIDLTGCLLLPAPAEPHAHHDRAFTADDPGAAGTPGPATAAAACPAEPLRRITEAALTSLGYGATAQRTHVPVGGPHGLRHLSAALTARQALHGLADLQVVAAPPRLTGSAGSAGADGRAALREALRLGADAVGGCPEDDPDPVGFVRLAVALATEFDRPLDLHLHGGDPALLARLLEPLAPLGTRVALGPLDRLAPGGGAALQAAGVRVHCLPQNGGCGGPARGLPFAAIDELTFHQLQLAAGSGALRDAVNPVGRADPLEAAYLLAAGGVLSPTGAYAAVSDRARSLLGLPPVRVAAGCPAELLAVRGESLAGALSGGHSRLVVHGGRVVSRTSAVREFADTPAPALPRQNGHHRS